MERNLLLRQLLECSDITGGSYCEESDTVTVSSVRGNIEENGDVSFMQTFVRKNENQWTPVGFPFQKPPGKVHCISESKRFKAVCVSNEQIQIWDRNELVTLVQSSNSHPSEPSEKFCTDSYFGGMCWSPDERYLIIVTENNPTQNSTSFYDYRTKCKTPQDPNKTFGKEYEFEEDFGDQIRILRTSLWMIRIFDDNHQVIKQHPFQLRKLNLPTELIPLQPKWSPKGQSIVFKALKRYHRKLGNIYCTNRASGLYQFPVNPEALFSVDFNDKIELAKPDALQPITSNCVEDFAASSPSFSPDGQTLVYATYSSPSYHCSCIRIRKIDWNLSSDSPAGASQTLVDKVDKPGPDRFPGLYASGPVFHWISKDTFFLNSVYYSNVRSFQVNIRSGALKMVDWFSKQKSGYSKIVSTTYKKKNCALIMTSSPTERPKLHLAEWNDAEQVDQQPTISTLTQYNSAPQQIIEEKLSHLKWKTFEVQPPDSDQPFECIMISPTNPGKYPLLVYPHGGPHSTMTTCYEPIFVFLALCGFHVLEVNYRGSIGFGQSFVASLGGKCGFQDVQDCKQAVDVACQFEEVDETKVCCIGGSHGGFLSAHLIGQYPDQFFAAVLRNPVTSIITNFTVADIPDWCIRCTEAELSDQGSPGDDGVWQETLTKEAGGTLSKDRLMRFYECSPIFYIDRVQTPTLIILGSKDQRVPAYQAKEYAYQLSSRNVPCRTLIYDEPHAITGSRHVFDGWLNITEWFSQWMPNN